MSREKRNLQNSKQNKISDIDYYPVEMAEGAVLFAFPKSKLLRLYKKIRGINWWIPFTRDGNYIFEKEVKCNSLNVSSNVGIVGDISIYGLLISDRIASDTVRNSHDAEVSTVEGSYTKLKTITFTRGLLGQARFIWQMKVLVYGTGYAKLYKNGVAISGTEKSTSSATYIAKTIDLTQDLVGGDKIELYAYTTDSPVYIKEFRVCYDIDPTMPTTIS